LITGNHHSRPRQPLDAESAEAIARLMAALATASRVRILACLRIADHTVGDLAAAIEMEQPAVSHQLRILRDLGLVRGTRASRHIVYGLHDSHVAALIDEALRHIDHVQNHRPEANRTKPLKEATT
jgi:DNA-binding transcriptional ArsR family regulator